MIKNSVILEIGAGNFDFRIFWHPCFQVVELTKKNLNTGLG